MNDVLFFDALWKSSDKLDGRLMQIGWRHNLEELAEAQQKLITDLRIVGPDDDYYQVEGPKYALRLAAVKEIERLQAEKEKLQTMIFTILDDPAPE